MAAEKEGSVIGGWGEWLTGRSKNQVGAMSLLIFVLLIAHSEKNEQVECTNF